MEKKMIWCYSITAQNHSTETHVGLPLWLSWLKNPPAMWETWVQSLGWEDPLEKGKATHSSILAWRIPGIVCPWGRKEWDTTERLSLSLSWGLALMGDRHLRSKWLFLEGGNCWLKVLVFGHTVWHVGTQLPDQGSTVTACPGSTDFTALPPEESLLTAFAQILFPSQGVRLCGRVSGFVFLLSYVISTSSPLSEFWPHIPSCYIKRHDFLPQGSYFNFCAKQPQSKLISLIPDSW